VFCEFDEDQKHVPERLRTYLPRLVPVLLSAMVYSKADREALEYENKQQLDSIPDRPEDMRPRHHQSRAVAYGQAEGDEDEEDEDAGADEAEGQWGLRKCAAATLDHLAGTSRDPDVSIPRYGPSQLYDLVCRPCASPQISSVRMRSCPTSCRTCTMGCRRARSGSARLPSWPWAPWRGGAWTG
jgi:hypothetical protein